MRKNCPLLRGKSRGNKNAGASACAAVKTGDGDAESSELRMALIANSDPECNAWCIDSGSTHHMTCSREDLMNFILWCAISVLWCAISVPYRTPQKVFLEDNRICDAKGEGIKRVQVSTDG